MARHTFCGQVHSIGTPCPDNDTVRSHYLTDGNEPMTMQDSERRQQARDKYPIDEVPNRKTRRAISKKRGYFASDKRGSFRDNSDYFGVRQPKHKGGQL